MHIPIGEIFQVRKSYQRRMLDEARGEDSRRDERRKLVTPNYVAVEPFLKYFFKVCCQQLRIGDVPDPSSRLSSPNYFPPSKFSTFSKRSTSYTLATVIFLVLTRDGANRQNHLMEACVFTVCIVR